MLRRAGSSHPKNQILFDLQEAFASGPAVASHAGHRASGFDYWTNAGEGSGGE